MLGVNVNVKRDMDNFVVALKLFLFLANRRMLTKLAHRGPQVGLHPHFAQGQGQGQRSRDMGNFVVALKLIASARRQVDGSSPNLHKAVPRSVRM